MFKKCLISIMIFSLIVCCGCARGLQKSCNTLRDVSEDISEIYPIFFSVAAEYPDKISPNDLKAIEDIQEIIVNLTNTTCGLSEIVQESEK